MGNKFSENLIKLDSIDSTNEEAFRRASGERLAVISNAQTAGRGRLGRTFLSEPGQGLYLSVLQSEVYEPQLTARVSVCICRLLRELSGLDLLLKWPNDIVFEAKKLCGILCEMRDNNIVIGMGINLYNKDFGELGSIATSFEVLGIPMDKELLRNRLLSSLDLLFDNYYETKEQDLAFYKQHSSVLNKDIYLFDGEKRVPAKALGFDENFGLIVLDNSGSKRTISSGEISLRLRSE